jgi:ribose/xylose/arabinose/galactoside ABC-type transport system permease subunit/ABC-type sugar transport system substrate-binding protein
LEKKFMKLSFKEGLQNILALVILMLFLSIASVHFLTLPNILNITEQSSINALLGIGLTFVIISGGIDLSVGSVLALSSMVAADLLVSGMSPFLACIFALGTGLFCGIINGLIISFTNIPPFIATLGMMLSARGLAKVYSGSMPISGLPDSFREIAGRVGGIPVFVIIVLFFFYLAVILLKRTKLGRYTYAIGGNETTAWLSGVPVKKYKIIIYGISGLLAGFCGILLAARLNSASPLAGDMYELYAIAAAVIGGVSLMGGEGKIWGTLIGALIMGVLRNGLNLLNVPSAWEGIVVGSVLVIAVIIDRYRHGEREKGSLPKSNLKIKFALCVSMFALFFFAFQFRVASTNADKELVLAFIPKTMANPFYISMEKGALEAAKKLNAKIITQAGERDSDIERQHQILENLIERKVDAILIAPSGAKEILPAIEKANKAKIPVIVLDSNIDELEAQKLGIKTETFIGSDNYLGGVLAAKYLAKELNGIGEVAIIEGTAGQESVDNRKKGFLEEIKKFPKMKVVASQSAFGDRGQGFTVAQNIIQAHPNLSGIFGANDPMALGAFEAVRSLNKPNQIKVVGFDASPDALDSIKKGDLKGSVAQFPDEMGRLGVENAINLLKGGKAPPKVLHTKMELIDKTNL